MDEQQTPTEEQIAAQVKRFRNANVHTGHEAVMRAVKIVAGIADEEAAAVHQKAFIDGTGYPQKLFEALVEQEKAAAPIEN